MIYVNADVALVISNYYYSRLCSLGWRGCRRMEGHAGLQSRLGRPSYSAPGHAEAGGSGSFSSTHARPRLNHPLSLPPSASLASLPASIQDRRRYQLHSISTSPLFYILILVLIPSSLYTRHVQVPQASLCSLHRAAAFPSLLRSEAGPPDSLC